VTFMQVVKSNYLNLLQTHKDILSRQIHKI
jgi:hypothetical protein